MQTGFLAVVYQTGSRASGKAWVPGDVGEECEEVEFVSKVQEPHGPHGICLLQILKLVVPPSFSNNVKN